jgi:hypothetical protein
MTIEMIRTRTPSGFFGALDKLASNRNIFFRGHQDSKWRLDSTLVRHRSVRHRPAPYTPTMSWDVDKMLRNFLINLKTTGRRLDCTDARG